MFSTTDTIVAIATPPGRGGIGVVRLSGSEARSITRCLITHPRELGARRATLSTARDADDQVVATYFQAPSSYTGEDVVEISAHGSPVVLRQLVASAIASGARLAEPGEFTLRAFLNGRMDLPQAEAVADLIDAVTPRQARAAFDQLQGTLTTIIGELDAALFDAIARLEASVDFPDEGYHFVDPGELTVILDGLIERMRTLVAHGARGRLVREGLQLVILGKPNVGKSSVFNALVGAARAIVTDVPGTTRDLVTEVIDLDGLRVTLVDTAGICETMDVVESEGVRRALQTRAVADLLLVIVDGSASPDATDEQVLSQTADYKRLIVRAKSDLGAVWHQPGSLSVSAQTGEGMAGLRAAIFSALDLEPLAERPEITNVRHIALIERAQEAIARAREAGGSGAGLSEEFVLADLQLARAALEEVTGRRATEDLLAHIFSRFCVGK